MKLISIGKPQLTWGALTADLLYRMDFLKQVSLFCWLIPSPKPTSLAAFYPYLHYLETIHM